MGAGSDRGDEGRDARGVVLVVRVEHDHDLGAGLERRVVAGLLVATVAPVLGVDDHVEPELAGDVHGLVRGDIVHEDDPVDQVVRDIGVRTLERPRGVVGRHDDHDVGAGRLGRLRHGGKGTRPVGPRVTLHDAMR
jgi:hypothetical protein